MRGNFFHIKATIPFASVLANLAMLGFMVTSIKPALKIRKSKIIFPHL